MYTYTQSDGCLHERAGKALYVMSCCPHSPRGRGFIFRFI